MIGMIWAFAGGTLFGLVIAFVLVKVILKGERRFTDQMTDFHVNQRDLMMTTHRLEIERLANALRFGAPEIPRATELPRMADTEERMARTIDESRVESYNATIEKGVTMLRGELEERGISLSDEEIRQQVASMMRGEAPMPYEGFRPQ